jgi:hypothetical protein
MDSANASRSSPALYIVTGGLLGGIFGGVIGAVLAEPERRKQILTELESLDAQSFQLLPYVKKRLTLYQNAVEAKLKTESQRFLENISAAKKPRMVCASGSVRFPQSLWPGIVW